MYTFGMTYKSAGISCFQPVQPKLSTETLDSLLNDCARTLSVAPGMSGMDTPNDTHSESDRCA